MIAIFEKITNRTKQLFTMPASLRWRKELGEANIEYLDLHLTDIVSLVYSLRIDNAQKYLQQKRLETMQRRGIKEVRQATEEDFDSL